MSPEILIDFASRFPTYTPSMEVEVRRELGISPTRFYQLLHRAVLTPEGMRADPITARRVRESLARSRPSAPYRG